MTAALGILTGGLLDDVCHELRSPIAAIRSYAELLEDELCGPMVVAQQDAVATILANTRRLDRQVQRLRDLMALEAGDLLVEGRSLSVRDLVERACEEFQPDCERRNVALQVEVADDLPAIHADEARVEGALFALLENAIESATHGDTVYLEARAGGDMVRLVVRGEPCVPVSNGEPAPPPSAIATDWGLDESAALPLGLGLALRSFESSVRSMGGSMWVEERPGGTARCIELQRQPIGG